MNCFADETLSQFARRLAAEYDVDSSSTQPIGSSACGLSYYFFSDHDGEDSLVPSLSLSSFGRLPSNPNTLNGIDSSFGQECAKLLSRPSKFNKQAIVSAPSFMLRNIVSSFGHILEVQTQQTILAIMESRERKLSRNNMNGQTCDVDLSVCYEDIVGGFTDLASKGESPSTPISACTSFTTMLPASCTSNNMHLENKIQMSLSFQARISVKIAGGKIITAKVQAPGLIMGIFKDQRSRPVRIEVQINTKALYESMRKESRSIAKKIISSVVGPHVFAKKSTAESSTTTTEDDSIIKNASCSGSSSPDSPTSVLVMNGDQSSKSISERKGILQNEKETSRQYLPRKSISQMPRFLRPSSSLQPASDDSVITNSQQSEGSSIVPATTISQCSVDSTVRSEQEEKALNRPQKYTRQRIRNSRRKNLFTRPSRKIKKLLGMSSSVNTAASQQSC